jgi:hypothetical protein
MNGIICGKKIHQNVIINMNNTPKEYNLIYIDAKTSVDLYEQLNKLGKDGWALVSFFDEPNKELKNNIKLAIFIRDKV